MWRHWSCIPQASLISLRMSVAARLSMLDGDLLITSSVMLKSPSRKSGRGRFAVLRAVSTSAQKVGCLLSWTGA